MIVAILCEGALASHPHPTPDARVAEYECKSLWLNVIILCTCQWTSPFWCACERTLLTSHPTPPHTTPQGSWLTVSCVSAQVSEIYVTQCASEWRRAREWNFQCASECLSWTCDSMNQRINDWVKSELSDSGNQWINEPMTPWINEPMKEGMDGWTNERMDGWASYFSSLSFFFTERPFRWGTSSLSHFFSEQPLVWATCALSCLPQLALFVASATQFFSSCRCHTAFRSPQLQSRFAARAAVSLGLWQPVANPHGIAERPHQIDHHPRGHYSAGLLGRSSPATGEAEKKHRVSCLSCTSQLVQETIRSLSGLWSEQLLCCATCASSPRSFSSSSCYDAFRNLQLQSRPLTGPGASYALLRAAVPMRFVTAGCKPA